MGRSIKIELARPKAGGNRAGGNKGGKFGGGSNKTSEKPEGCDTLFVGNCSDDITEDAIKELFSDCGEVVDIRWVNDKETGNFKGYYLFFNLYSKN